MLFTASVIAFGFGVLCFVDSDFVWTLFEMDARITGSPIRRTNRWESHVLMHGVVLLVTGGLGILVSSGLVVF